jgi:DNA-binding SARP family transcriptional activator
MPERRGLGAAAAAPVVRVLGPIGLSAGGTTWRVGPPKARDLLALLALRPRQFASAERLIDELWDGTPPRSAASALRMHVRDLRRALAAHATGVTLDHGPAGYALQVAPDRVDAVRAARLLREAAGAPPTRRVALCDEALGLWSGEPYANAGLRSVEAERHRLVELRLGALELRAEARAELAPPDAQFVADLTAMVAEAPLRERFTELLMVALYRLQREPAALAAYQRLRQRLAEQLGLEPSRSVRELEGAILRRSDELGWVATPAAPADRVLRPATGPLVGRTAELARLRAVREAPGGVALVLGEAGIGKSRVVAELAAGLSAEGTRVVAGSCDPERSITFRPFVEVVRALRAAGLAAGAVPLAGARPGGAATPDERLRMFVAVGELLDEVGRASPGGLVVVVEDLHWVDDASAELLRFLLEARPPLPLVVVGTARTDEPEESVTWSRLRRDLLAPGVAIAVEELAGLSRDEVATLVAGWAPTPAQAATAPEAPAPVPASPPETATPPLPTPATGEAPDSDLLFELTRGNPLLVGQLLAMGAPAGGTRYGDAVPVPRQVAESVRHRLHLLARPARRALEVAALAGERADTAVVARTLGVGVADVYGHRGEAVERYLLVDDEEAAEEVRFPHALVREAIVAATPASRRRHHRLRLAGALRSAPPSHERDVAIARHLLAAVPACPLAEAAAVARAAAEQAVAGYAFEQAVALVDQVLDHPHAGRVEPEARARLRLVQGTAQVHLGRLDEAGRALGEAAALARNLGDPHLLAAAALGGDPPDRPTEAPAWRVALLQEALARLDGHDCAERVRVMSALARDGATPGRYVDRQAMADSAVTLARRLGEGPELFTALTACHLQHLGRPSAAALGRADELVRLSQVTGDPVWATRAHLMRARERFCSGDMSGAEADIAVHRELAEHTRRPVDRWQASLVAATVARIRGDLDEADRAAAAAREVSQRVDLSDADLTQGIHDFFVHWHRGRVGDLAPFLDLMVEANPTFPVLRLAAALAWVEAGDTRAAAAGAVVHDSPHDELFPTRLALGALVASAAGDRAAAGPLAEALAPCAGRFIVTGALTATWGPADRYRSMLARLLGEPAAAVKMAEAAVALANTAGATVWRLWSRAELSAGLAASDRAAARQVATDVVAEASARKLDGPAGAAAAVLAGLP